MAIFRIPHQQIEVNLPDENVIFRGVPGNSQDVAFRRVGNVLYQMPRAQFQGNFESLPQINPGLEGLELLRGHAGLVDRPGDASIFSQPIAAPSQPEVITLTPGQQNPNAAVVTSSTKGLIRGETPVPAGVTPTGQLGAGGFPILQTPGQQPQIGGAPSPYGGQQDLTHARELLQQGNILGQKASKKTGVPFQPTQVGQPPSPQAPAAPQTPTAPPIVPITAPVLSANDMIRTYETIANALGIPDLQKRIAGEISAVTAQANAAPSYQSILQAELDRRGISRREGIVADLDSRITTLQKTIRDTPKDILEQAQYHGITAAQLERITYAQAKPMTDDLRDLLAERNVTQEQIDRSIQYAESFTNGVLKDQATRLEGFKWSIDMEEGLFKDLESEQKTIYKAAVDERKDILGIAEEVAKAGGNQQLVNDIAGSSSPQEALSKAAGHLQQKLTTHFETIGGQRVEVVTDPQGRIVSQTPLGIAGTTGITGVGGVGGNIDSIAQSLIEGRTVPSQLPGFGQNSLKAQALRRAFEIDPKYNPAKAESEFSFGKTASTQNRVRRIDNVSRTIDEAITLSNNIQRTNIKPINQAYIAFLGRVGSSDAARLTTISNLLGDELGQIFSGSTASDFKTRLGLSLTDPSLSQQQFISVLNEIKKNMGFVKDSLTKGTQFEGATEFTTPSPVTAPQQPTGMFQSFLNFFRGGPQSSNQPVQSSNVENQYLQSLGL